MTRSLLGLVARGARAVEAFWMVPQPLHGLVAARVLLGLTLFSTYAGRVTRVQEYFGPGGFAGSGFYARNPGADPLDPFVAAPLRLLTGVSSEVVVAAAFAAAVLASLAFAAGAWTRVSGAILLGLHLLFYARNGFAWDGSWAGYVVAPLAYTIIAPTGRFVSIDAWRRRRAAGRSAADPPSWLAPGWPLRLLQIHTCAMYLAAGLSRVDKPSWIHGDMVYVAMTGMTHSRLGIDWTPFREVFMLGSWAALALEALAPVLLWIPGLGVVWALGLVAMHLTLEALTNVGHWSHVMIAGLMAFILPWPGRWSGRWSGRWPGRWPGRWRRSGR